ncbi:MAG: carboxyl-terminal processing protease [Verrucomicrobiales bacterium]|jgi:carboxyl-terminal processing protease
MKISTLKFPALATVATMLWAMLAAPAAAQNDQLPEKDPDAEPDEAPSLIPDEGEDDFGYREIELLATVIELIRQNYVDEKEITYEQLMNSALEGMLSNLDPHCQFMHPDVFQQMQRETNSTYEGVGVTVAYRNDVLTIVAVREDGPAAREGVLPGDQVLKINDFLADKVGLTEAMQLMRGKPGQKLALTLRRPANNQLLEVEMVREVIRESTIRDVVLLEPRYSGDLKIGYLRLTQFNEPSAGELVEALDDLERQGMEALVFDMRNNPGGLLSSAIQVCGEFVPPGTVVLTTEGRNKAANTKVYRTSPAKRRPRDYPLAILVNHGSASGAEVVSGALQDLHRAIIVGVTTFGKGSVQSIIPVPGRGNAIRLTTAKYYTPSKRTIHENGVEPNIVATLTPQEEVLLMKWFRRETLPPAEQEKAAKWTDRQLGRAVDALKGALIYAEVLGAKPEPVVEPKPEPKKPKPDPKPKPAPKPAAADKEKPDSKDETPDPKEEKPDSKDETPDPAPEPEEPGEAPATDDAEPESDDEE